VQVCSQHPTIAITNTRFSASPRGRSVVGTYIHAQRATVRCERVLLADEDAIDVEVDGDGDGDGDGPSALDAA
jgi:hypothetical protein